MGYDDQSPTAAIKSLAKMMHGLFVAVSELRLLEQPADIITDRERSMDVDMVRPGETDIDSLVGRTDTVSFMGIRQ